MLVFLDFLTTSPTGAACLTPIRLNLSLCQGRLPVQLGPGYNIEYGDRCGVLVDRVPLIGRLPPILTSFRIISSQSVCSTFLIIAMYAVNQAF